MRVLQQLIQHFWQRGALSGEQVDYLVEHGLVRASDLGGYVAQTPAPEETQGDFVPPSPPLPPLGPDELDRAEDALLGQAVRKWKRGKSGLKTPDLTPAQLGARLEGILASRADCFAALAELAGLPQTGASGQEAAVALRHLEEDAFHDRLLRGVQARPALLAEAWECLDVEPFHDLLGRPDVKGRPAQSFAAILRSAAPGQWGPVAAALHVPAVQTVANLLAARRRLLPAVLWLFEQHSRRLARCLQRPAHPRRSWDGLAFGLVLLYNARAQRKNRTPAGFAVEKRLAPGGWREAWTVAVTLDPAAVTPFCIHVFGNPPGRGSAEVGDLAARDDVALICPSGWKV